MNDSQVFKEVCENDFGFYAKHFLKVVEPETEFEWNWHLDLLCHHCEKVFYGEISNLDINIPPRMLKSIIVSVLFPTWIWIKLPSFKIIGASSTTSLARLFNIKRREIIESEPYQHCWPIKIKDYMNTINKFENTYNGFMQSVSVGSSIIGQGADLIISDDLIDPKEAFSKTIRESTTFWYGNTLYGRVQNKANAKRININQRLHMNDVSGYIESTYKNFVRLVIPMQKMEKNNGTLHWEDPREVGEFIQPSRYGPKQKEDEYTGLGIYGWSSQMQQSPIPVGGGIIKEEWIRKYSILPKCNRIIITGDLAFKKNASTDYVCFQCWGKKGKDKYLIDIVRGRWSFKETKEHFKEFVAKHNYASSKFIEDKANGPALIDDLKAEINGILSWPQPSKPKLAKLDKIQRLHMVSQEYENGLVYLPEGITLVELFEQELTSFTEKGSTTGNDDMVDTSTMALIELKETSTFFAG